MADLDPNTIASIFRQPPTPRAYSRPGLGHATRFAGEAWRLTEQFKTLAPKVAAIDGDPRLSPQGRAAEKAKLVEQFRATMSKVDLGAIVEFRQRGLQAAAQRALPKWPSDAGEAILACRRLDRLHSMADGDLQNLVVGRDPVTLSTLAMADAAERQQILARLPRFESGVAAEATVLDEALRLADPVAHEELQAAAEAAEYAQTTLAAVAGRVAAGNFSDSVIGPDPTGAERATRAAVLDGKGQDRATELLAQEAARVEAREAAEAVRFAEADAVVAGAQ